MVNAQFCTCYRARSILRCLQSSMVHLEMQLGQRLQYNRFALKPVEKGRQYGGLTFLLYHAFS